MNGLEMVQALIQRGYQPHQAAALAGHFLQESGGNPASVNSSEDAHGLSQWRGDRWQNLQSFAKSQGKDPTDPQVQLDFVGKEMSGPEAKSSQAFRNSTDVASASAALKPVIRYADPEGSQTALRTNNAVGLLAQYNASGQPVAPTAALAPVDPTNPADPTQTLAAAGAPLSLAPGASPVGTLASSLQTAGGKIAAAGGNQKQAAPDFLAPQQIQMGQPNTGQAQQIAAQIAKSYGIGA